MERTLYAARTNEPRICADADEVEFIALRNVSAVIDDAARDEIVSGELDDESEINAASESDRHAWQEQDLAQEALVGSAVEEIENRINLLGSAYPFELTGNKLTYRASTTGFYEFCLATVSAPTITTKPYVRFPRMFERVVAGLVRTYFGPKASALHTGWPRLPKSRFKKAMSPLSRYKNEWVWRPEDDLDADPSYVVVKDESVDFVVTTDLLDNRPGNLYVLGQCACGNDWDSKLGEPELAQISKWFGPAWLIPPVRAFTTPFVIGEETIRETSRKSRALVFDRVRLALIAETMIRAQIRKPIRRRLEIITSLVTKRA